MKEYVRRFHIPPIVAEKALEYYRLAEMKCPAVRGTCLILVCIQLACTQLGEPFDKVGGMQSTETYIITWSSTETSAETIWCPC